MNVEDGRYILLDDTADLVTIINARVKIGTWVRNVRYAEVSAIRSADHWSDVKAVTRAKDEILEALVDLQQLEMAQANDLSSYLDNYKPHRVLVLRDFQPEGRRRLDEIKANLAKSAISRFLSMKCPTFHITILYRRWSQLVHRVGLL